MGLIVKYNTITQTLKRFVNVIAVSLNAMKALFSDFVILKKYELQFNAQSIYLSKYLNLEFDPEFQRIFIINDITLTNVFIHTTGESIPADEETYIFTTAEVITADEETYIDKNIELQAVSFIVAVPTELARLVTSNLFNASIKKYSFAGKTFSIIVV